MPVPRQRLDYPKVALVGRTNVGKSSLWNRLTEQGKAIVSEEEHTTRDRQYGYVLWRGAAFELIDTGGMDTEDNAIGEGILHQSQLAVKEADVIIFVYDAKSGVLPQDIEFARELQSIKKPVILVANKVDTIRDTGSAYSHDVYRLGLGDPWSVSASTSLGIGDLCDHIQLTLDKAGKPAVMKHDLQPLRIVMVGRPNVGKSSLVNSILGEERVIVSPIPHTTREPQDTLIKYNERDIVLVDTAGMRKRSADLSTIDEESLERNREAVKRSDVALLVFDATQDPTSWDRHIAGMLQESYKGLILVANKWDLVEKKDTNTASEYEMLIRQLFPFLNWAPMIFVSAKDNIRSTKLIDLALEVQDERMRHIDYNAANKMLKKTIQRMKPLASYGPKSPRVFDVAQIDHAPPTFMVTVHGEKDNLHPNWLKFFEKRLREKFGFVGTPIKVKVQHLPMAKSDKPRNVFGPGMEAVAGKVREKKKLVNQTMRRQKKGRTHF